MKLQTNYKHFLRNLGGDGLSVYIKVTVLVTPMTHNIFNGLSEYNTDLNQRLVNVKGLAVTNDCRHRLDIINSA